MTHVHGKIQRWGNSLAIRLTGTTRTIPRFVENMNVDIEVSEEGLYITPEKKPLKLSRFSEAELLADMTPTLAHADELISPTLSELEYK